MFIVAATAGDNPLGGADDPVLNKVNWADPDPGLTPENYDLALVTSEFMLLVCWPLWHQDRKASVYALYFRIWNRLENGASNRDFSFVALRTYGTSDGHGQSKAFNKLGIAKVFEWKEPEGYIAHRKGPKLDVMNKGFKYDLGPANVPGNIIHIPEVEQDT
ncbi:hypothetical protein COL26b_011139 [Colletotrichum chrysophilum]|uniref:uncharacterized protein n=1 Tax=Colletotrichum chrysophilum TaxID=1836956 RepID=UPI0023012C86|nr:uncharacterized protein COL26b_011139 [Colletotrichum chrysophilum]KAJ0367676.1 hypothetical protein COL26b_011139 [Colletotrichum chrysophilum]